MTYVLFFSLNRPEVKENKEGADTEKAAEQDKNESEKELAKDKVRLSPESTKHSFNISHLI